MRPLAIFVTLLLFSLPTYADQFTVGKSAYDIQDYKTAVKIWQPLAEKGNAEAAYYLSVMYRNGFGVKQNDAMADKWLHSSAEHGSWHAYSELAERYYPSYACKVNGGGLKECSTQNYSDACFWYLLSIKPMTATHVHTTGGSAKCDHLTADERMS